MRLGPGDWAAYVRSTEVEEGQVWRVREIVSDGTNSRTYTSGTQTVQPIPLFPPVNTVAPAITGTLQVGETLTVSDGTWDPAATSYNRCWTRNGTPIGGAAASTYDLVEDDDGQTIGARRCKA